MAGKRANGVVIVWEFRVKVGKRREFERVYGPDGAWAKLFRKDKGYLRTELIRDLETPRRYLTIDFWNSREAYRRFKKQSRPEYQALDEKCASLTEDEVMIGEFHEIAGSGRWRPLGDSVLVTALSRHCHARLSKSRCFAAGARETRSSRLRPGCVEDRAEFYWEMKIRDARSDDLGTMLALARRSPTAAHWADSFYQELFEEGALERILLVAEDDGGVAGFLIARIAGDECELENVVVAERSRRSGIGSSLTRALGDRVRGRSGARIFLEVRESNAAARALYEKCGFQINGRRVAYYRDPQEDAVRYVWVP